MISQAQKSLQSRRSFRKICQILSEKSLSYLFSLLLNLNRIHNTKRSNHIRSINVRHDLFKNLFFPCTLSAWNKLNSKIISISASFNIFKKNLLNFIRPSTNSILDFHKPCGFKLLKKLRLGLSHPYQHKFRHCFQDTLPVAKIQVLIYTILDKLSFIILEKLTNRFYLKVRR